MINNHGPGLKLFVSVFPSFSSFRSNKPQRKEETFGAKIDKIKAARRRKNCKKGRKTTPEKSFREKVKTGDKLQIFELGIQTLFPTNSGFSDHVEIWTSGRRLKMSERFLLTFNFCSKVDLGQPGRSCDGDGWIEPLSAGPTFLLPRAEKECQFGPTSHMQKYSGCVFLALSPSQFKQDRQIDSKQIAPKLLSKLAQNMG